jgi:single-strand DNA-binding protein
MNNKTKNSVEPKAAPAYQNRVTLVGYLGRAPEQLEDRAVLSLATKVSWKAKDSDEWQSRSDWHRIVAWDKLAEAVRSLAKGDHIMVEGELRSSEWNDLYRVDDGTYVPVKVRVWEVRARSVRKLVRKKKTAKATAIAA